MAEDSAWVRIKIDKRHYHYSCKKCNAVSKYKKTKFCPNCGRVMLNANYL